MNTQKKKNQSGGRDIRTEGGGRRRESGEDHSFRPRDLHTQAAIFFPPLEAHFWTELDRAKAYISPAESPSGMYARRRESAQGNAREAVRTTRGSGPAPPRPIRSTPADSSVGMLRKGRGLDPPSVRERIFRAFRLSSPGRGGEGRKAEMRPRSRAFGRIRERLVSPSPIQNDS